jgi:hypothetical protein
LIPITKEMIEGKEPLRTFSDLLQFCQHQEEPKETAPASATASAQKVTSAQQPGEHQPRNIESGLKDTSNGAQETEAANQTGSNATEPHAAANWMAVLPLFLRPIASGPMRATSAFRLLDPDVAIRNAWKMARLRF